MTGVAARQRRALLSALGCLVLMAAAWGLPASERPTTQSESPGRVVLAAAQGGTDRPDAEARPEPAPAGPVEPAPEPRQVSITMGGDLLWHDTVWESAAADHARTGRGRGRFDFDPMFAALRGLVRSADLAICHEEVPFAEPGGPYSSYPVFAAPPEIARWLGDFGWDACTTASNHAVDQGFEGLRRTASLLERAGVQHAGTFRTAAERRRPVILEANGVRVAIVAGTYGLNGFPLPEGRPWSVSMLDADDLLAQARRARGAGADVVLVALHWGWEYTTLPNPEQVALARRLTRSPAVDLVYGAHAHVVQPITKVNGKWVAYGLGNMIAQQETARPYTYEGISVRFTFRERPGGRFEVTDAAYIPTSWNVYGGGKPIRITRDVPADRLQRIREAVHALGGTRGLRER